VRPALALQKGGMEVNDENLALMAQLAEYDKLMSEDHETPAILRALEGRFVRPAPGGDLLRTPEILPTGRNLHGFDPFRLPSVFAVKEGARHAQLLLDRHLQDGNPCRSPSRWCSGAPTTSRPRAGPSPRPWPDRRQAAARQLRSRLRCRADPLESWASADRRGDDAVRHLP
jgi:hypothetical protein